MASYDKVTVSGKRLYGIADQMFQATHDGIADQVFSTSLLQGAWTAQQDNCFLYRGWYKNGKPASGL